MACLFPRSNKEKAERITEIKALLSAEKPIGNPSDGYTVFAQQCAACHRFKDQGRDIGPDLTGYEMKNLDYLVPAIIDPNLGIREGFELSTNYPAPSRKRDLCNSNWIHYRYE